MLPFAIRVEGSQVRGFGVTAIQGLQFGIFCFGVARGGGEGNAIESQELFKRERKNLKVDGTPNQGIFEFNLFFALLNFKWTHITNSQLGWLRPTDQIERSFISPKGKGFAFTRTHLP